MTSFEDPEYFSDKPRADIRKTVMCTVLSVLTKSAAALLVRRRLDDLPSKWNVVCVPYAGDGTRAEMSSLLGETKPFAKDIQVTTKRFEANSWFALYATSTVFALFFFLMQDDCGLVAGIQKRFDNCVRFEGETLMELVGHDWPSVAHTQG